MPLIPKRLKGVSQSRGTASNGNINLFFIFFGKPYRLLRFQSFTYLNLQMILYLALIIPPAPMNVVGFT